jgi:serine/threonine protein kinase
VAAPQRTQQPKSILDQSFAEGTPSPTPQLTPSGYGRSEGSAPVAMLPAPGARINQYELIREIGAGGMGTVYLARDLRLGRRVAIKFLQSQHPELNQRFILEARATAQCSHENIVIIYEVGEHFGAPYMVLEYLSGMPLNKILERGLQQTPQRAIELMIPVLRALICAHEHEIAHRDLKPENVFVTDTGTTKVLDFGIAKVIQRGAKPEPVAASPRLPNLSDISEQSTQLTRSGAIMGTPQYMSPEQWGIGVEIDHRTDIWAVGIMLFKMLVGQHPLAPLEGTQLVVTAFLDQPMPRIRDVAPSVPQALAEVVDKCLQKRKEDRYPTAKALLEALEAATPGQTTRQIQLYRSPYAGLSAFQEGDSDRFFGRSKEVAAMTVRLRDRAMLAVVGPSGVGKSSFMRAGVVPALKASGEAWESPVIRPSRQPMQALAHLLNPYVAARSGQTVNEADEEAEERELVKRLLAEPGYCGTILRSQARRQKKKLLLFVDQFEEIFTLVDSAEERLGFMRCLAAMGDDPSAPLRVVLSMRSDFLDRMGEDPSFLQEISQGLFFLQPPGRDGLRDALVEPAQMVGYQFETPTMVEDMLDHLETTPGALPLLQFAASKLWDARDQAQRLLTMESYVAMGGIAGALASHADAVLAEMPSAQQALCRDIVLRLITPERTRAIVSLAELQTELGRDAGDIKRLVDHLVAARLLVVQSSAAEGAAGTTVEIVHESLIQSWPSLRRWLDENQDDAEILDRLRTAARQWQAKGRDAGLLWTGDTADEARRWARRYTGPLLDVQRQFLEAVISKATRSARLKKLAIFTTISILSLMVAAAGVALVLIRQAQQAAVENEQKAVVAQGRAEDALKVAQEKEAARLKAEGEKVVAQEKVVEKEKELGVSEENLAQRNKELEAALVLAKENESKAQEEKVRAEKNAQEAIAARADAEAAKGRVERLLEQEKLRAKKLQDQLGSPMVDTLK